MYEVPEETQSLSGAITSTSVFGPRSPVTSSASARGRLLTAILCLPGFFTINRTIEAVPATLLLILFWLILDRRKTNLRSARAFIYLTPGLILINSLIGNSEFGISLFRFKGLSLNGAVVGLALSLRLLWTFLLVSVLFRSTPLDEMMTLFRSIFRFLHLPERECSETVAMTLTLLPDFASFPVKGIRNLPEAIAERITATENRIKTVRSSGFEVQSCPNHEPRIKNQEPRFRPLDLALVLPAALFLIFTIIT